MVVYDGLSDDNGDDWLFMMAYLMTMVMTGCL
jgi:hypothetical protein